MWRAKLRPGSLSWFACRTRGERILLTIADYDRQRGTLALVVQEVGKTTMLMGAMHVGDRLASLTGPLGHPSEIEHCVAQ